MYFVRQQDILDIMIIVSTVWVIYFVHIELNMFWATIILRKSRKMAVFYRYKRTVYFLK